ncbi:XRE family transcriptional regulator, partial [Escherichia coli]|nr:XRE family transcriptional regulator [Escherichia coli]
VRDNGWNQTEAAAHLGISQPRVSNMLKGKLDKFSSDSLLEIMFTLGYKLDMQVHPSSEVILEMGMKKAML